MQKIKIIVWECAIYKFASERDSNLSILKFQLYYFHQNSIRDAHFLDAMVKDTSNPCVFEIFSPNKLNIFSMGKIAANV
jgi:hypothetical protein